MICKVDNYYVIFSGGSWLPGNYDNEKTARYAFQFSTKILQKLQEEINYKGKSITLNDLRDKAA